ncbi:hypothetical protein [Psychrobacter sp. I-STPA10]|uniref:hypothetical protein n=1 Tax=Psychrobacter sp. I-STPA10 TaxID=2585769 RepID=UPI001E5DE74F|nr:hypothetical protein [Psychrobacter sp. I-STPA10]
MLNTVLNNLLNKPLKHKLLKQNPLTKAIVFALFGGLTISTLTACGSSDDRANAAANQAHHHDHDHHHEHDDKVDAEVAQGRLFIADHDNNKAYVYSLAQNKIIQTLDDTGHIDTLQTSPQGKYALALNREDNKVSFYHSGLRVEDHGDHSHNYANEVRKVLLQLNYATPNHYQIHGKQAGLFFDGKGEKGNPVDKFVEPAGFALITDSDIDAGKLPYQKLTPNMHGTAEAQGDYVITTARLESTGSSLADRVVVYQQHHDHYHKHQDLPTACPSLHGSGSAGDYSVFACGDGVVSVHKVGDKFTSEKLPNPMSIANAQCQRPNRPASPARIGSFATSPHHEFLVGTACGQPHLINPTTKAFTPITWTSDASRKVLSYEFDSSGNYLLLLDDLGKVTILDVAQNFKPIKTLDVIANSVADGGHGGPALVVNPNSDNVYVLDASKKQIVVIDPKTASLKPAIGLNFTPSEITWFGVKKEK